MRPTDIQQIGTELAVKWDDGTETFVPLEALRRHCPCAGCKGEMGIMGNVYKNPPKPLTAKALNSIRFRFSMLSPTVSAPMAVLVLVNLPTEARLTCSVEGAPLS